MKTPLPLFCLTLLLFWPLSLKSLPYTDDEIIDYDRGEYICMDEARVHRFDDDFNLQDGDAQDFEDLGNDEFLGDWCSGDLWKLLWSLNYLEEFSQAVERPSRWVRNLYNWTKTRTHKLGYSTNGPGARPVGYTLAWNQGSGYIFLTPNFFNLRPLYRTIILVHEARHSAAGQNHVNCTRGPYRRRTSCDQSFTSGGGGGPYSYTINLMAWLYYNGKDDEVSPALKEWARNTGNNYLDNLINQPSDYRIE